MKKQSSQILLLISVLLILFGCGRSQKSDLMLAARIIEEHDLIVPPRGNERRQTENGMFAQGRVNDWILQNDKIRVIIADVDDNREADRFVPPSEKVGPPYDDRELSPCPYGGNIIDADIQRKKGERGIDRFGAMCLLLDFGLTTQARKVELVDDGIDGVQARLRVSGLITTNDYYNLGLSKVSSSFNDPAKETFRADPELVVENIYFQTDYMIFVGNSHVDIRTTIYNDTDNELILPFADVIVPGGDLDYYFPAPELQHAFPGRGFGPPDKMVYDGVQFWSLLGEGVSYGFSFGRIGEINTVVAGPELSAFVYEHNAVDLLTSAGVMKSFNPTSVLTIKPGDKARFDRRMYVGSGDVGTLYDDYWETIEVEVGNFEGRTVEYIENPPPGTSARPALGVDVAVLRLDAMGRWAPFSYYKSATSEADYTSDAIEYFKAGRFGGKLPEAEYRVVANQIGHPYMTYNATTHFNQPDRLDDPKIYPLKIVKDHDLVEPMVIEIMPSAKISFHISEEANGVKSPIPGKMTVIGKDPSPDYMNEGGEVFFPFRDTRSDNPGAGVARVVDYPYTKNLNYLEFDIEPGYYDFIISHGPFYSMAVMLDKIVEISTLLPFEGVLSQVMEGATGKSILSADLNVKTMSSATARISYEDRLDSALTEDLDVVVTADENAVSSLDYQIFMKNLKFSTPIPISAFAGTEAIIPGLTSFTTWPFVHLLPNDSRNGGPIDWGYDDLNLNMTPDQLIAALRAGIYIPESAYPTPATKMVSVGHAFSGARDDYFSAIDFSIDWLGDAEFFVGPDSVTPPIVRTPVGESLMTTDWESIEIYRGSDDFDKTALNKQLLGWFDLLNAGTIIPAIGVSGTKTRYSEPVGYPRVVFQWSPSEKISAEYLISKLQKMEHQVTNGPFISMMTTLKKGSKVLSTSFGGIISTEGAVADPDNEIEVELTIQSPILLEIDKLEVFSNTKTEGVDPASAGSAALYSFALNFPNPVSGADNLCNSANTNTSYIGRDGQFLGLRKKESKLVCKFKVTANFSIFPEHDSWYVFRVSGSKSAYPLMPSGIASESVVSSEYKKYNEDVRSAWKTQSLTEGHHAYAVSSPLFVDTDATTAANPVFDPPCVGTSISCPNLD